MSLTQVDKDFLLVREKVLTENETFLKKFQNNMDYSLFKKKNKKTMLLPIILALLFCIAVGVSVFFLYKYFPNYYVYEFIIGIVLILLAIAIIIALCTKKLKQENSVNTKGFYNAVLTIENSYDKLLAYVNSINIEIASSEEKLKFYEGLEKVFSNLANTLSKTYSNKTKKLKKLKNCNLNWQWLIKYLYNFGKFCFNKKQDCKSFVSLLSM